MLRQVLLRLRPPPRSRHQTEISRFFMKSPNWRGFVRAFCLCGLSLEFQGWFWGLRLCPAKSRFPTAGAGVGGDLFEC